MKQQVRATFEDVCNSQDALLIFLDKCIDGNKVLSNDEKNIFIKLFRTATLGLASEHVFFIKGKNRGYKYGSHVAHAACLLAYHTSNKVQIGDYVFDIKTLWMKLRDYCFKIFPSAQEMSIKISKEIVDMYSGHTSSFDYDDLKKR